jgi:protein-S-isoprenylcysteine O-methyltransferase Ste14
VSNPEIPEEKPRHRIRISRRTAVVSSLPVVLIVYPFIVGVLPWAISLLTSRYGWTDQGSSIWNFLGLILVAVGIIGLVWVFSTLFAQFPKLPWPVELDEGKKLLTATSRILVTHGPFAISRNPMFLSGLIVLLGWAVFYGSLAVLILPCWGGHLRTTSRCPQRSAVWRHALARSIGITSKECHGGSVPFSEVSRLMAAVKHGREP